MGKAVFNLAALDKLEGLRDDFNTQLAAAVRDCKERPGVTKAREITVKIKVTPYPGDPDDVVVETTLSAKGPSRVVPAYRMQSTANDGLKFQPGSPLEPDQGDLFDDEE